jgi:hypothetical protein
MLQEQASTPSCTSPGAWHSGAKVKLQQTFIKAG